MHFALQGSAGTYRAFTERFCDGKLDDLGHWDDAGSSNEDELSLRLSAMSYRKLRRDPDVAPWLPKTDRAVILCSLTADQMKRYKKLEKHFAPEAAAAIKAQNGAIRASERGLKELVRATSEAKIQTAIDRAFEHTEQREVKVICTAHFHETLLDLDRQFDQAQAGAAITGSTIPPHFCAGGWMAPAKRREIIDRWKACPGPAILLINSLSSGVGIDLADADVMILLELEWVPADLAQLESRIQDIHLGKRTVPPILEYLLAKDTVDESMARALLDKIKSIEAVVGSDSESAGLKHTLRNSDLVESGALGLENNSRETVLAALRSVSERWDLITTDDQGLNEIAGDFSEHWEEDNEEEITF
jgi:SNF2 family DNA or RNA helicase